MSREISLSDLSDLNQIPARLKGEQDWWKIRLLKRWANGLHAYYGAPVYLVGSILDETNPNPRDVDIRIIMPDDEFALRFGLSAAAWIEEGESGLWSEAHHRWGHECARRSAKGHRHTHLPIDCQILPELEHNKRYVDKRKVRLDDCRLCLDDDYAI